MIQRYNGIEEDDEGIYVEYADHLEVIKEKEEQLSECRKVFVDKAIAQTEQITALKAHLEHHAVVEIDGAMYFVASSVAEKISALTAEKNTIMKSVQQLAEIYDMVVNNAKRLTADRDTAMSMLEDAEGRVLRLTGERDALLKEIEIKGVSWRASQAKVEELLVLDATAPILVERDDYLRKLERSNDDWLREKVENKRLREAVNELEREKALLLKTMEQDDRESEFLHAQVDALEAAAKEKEQRKLDRRTQAALSKSKGAVIDDLNK